MMELDSHRLRVVRARYDPGLDQIRPPDHYSRGGVIAFHALSLFGFLTCLLLTVTILFTKSIIRHKSVPNFFGVLSFSALMVLITWFNGNVDVWETQDPPSFQLCLFQSSMIAGISTAQGAAASFLVFQVWLSVSRLVFSSKSASYFSFMESPFGQWILIASPWGIWAVYAIATLVLGTTDPSTVSPNSLYCATTHTKLVAARHYSSAIFSVIVVVLQLHLVYMSGSLYMQSRRPRRTAATIANNDHGIVIDLEGLEDLLQPSRFNMGPFVVRVLLFGLYTCFLVSATIYIAIHPKAGHTVFPDVTNASIAPAAFIVFGSQSDCLLAWRTGLSRCSSKLRSLLRYISQTRRQQSNSNEPDDVPHDIQRLDHMVASKSHIAGDVGVNVSMDSQTTTESGDSQKQQLPVLMSAQSPQWSSEDASGKTDESKEDEGNDLDFFAALAMK